MKPITIFIFSLIIIFSILCTNIIKAGNTDGREINDPIFKFSVTLPDGWITKDIKETSEKDGISYSLFKDSSSSIMILAFKLTTVKNLDDFIYNIEKDAGLNIPAKSGDYTVSDAGEYDMKSAVYKDVVHYEYIYYYRTKLVDAPNNYVYMLRFIVPDKFNNSDMQSQVKKISDSFLPTAK